MVSENRVYPDSLPESPSLSPPLSLCSLSSLLVALLTVLFSPPPFHSFSRSHSLSHSLTHCLPLALSSPPSREGSDSLWHSYILPLSLVVSLSLTRYPSLTRSHETQPHMQPTVIVHRVARNNDLICYRPFTFVRTHRGGNQCVTTAARGRHGL